MRLFSGSSPGDVISAALFAAGGALVSRQEDLPSTITPISLLVQVGFGLGVFVTSDPGGTLARVATFVPPVAPFVARIRVAQNEISTAEQVGSVLVAAGFGVITILIAAQIYTRAICT